MKLGIAEWSLDTRGGDALEAARRFGFDCVHFGVATLQDLHSLGSSAGRAALRAHIRTLDLGIGAVACNFFEDLGFDKDCDRAKMMVCLDGLVRAAEIALEVGCGMVYIPSFGASRMRDSEDLVRTAELLAGACARWPDRHLLLASESTLNVGGCCELFARVDDPRFKILFDAYNPCAHGIDPLKLLGMDERMLAPHAHIKDGIGSDLGCVPVGEGEGRLDATLAQIASGNLFDTLVLETDYRRLGIAAMHRDINRLRCQFNH